MCNNQELLRFIQHSPSMFHTVESIRAELQKNGFSELKESENWSFTSGKYYVIRNHSSIIALDIPAGLRDYHYQLCASHSDSPTYKLKAAPELAGPGGYLRLNVEAYGSMIDYTWLDKPLSIAGRVLVKKGNVIESQLLYIDRDILLIPSLAIHMNRDVNKGYAFNRQVDLCPLFGNGKPQKGDFDRMIAAELGVDIEEIIARDLFLVNRQEGKIWGAAEEFISAPKLDDLQAAFASLQGFLAAENPGCINVYACFDNEEVGSGTKQGAKSTFLADVLTRVNGCLGKTADDYCAAIARSYMVSFDNAHALHPNHPEKADAENRPMMNAGIVIKENAAQSYTTDAFSRAVFKEICARKNVPTQVFANRSDSAGGSTLGNISNMQVSMHCVDIGIAQLAMHSAYETAGSMDTAYAITALQEYYSSDIRIEGAEKFSIL